MAVLATIRDGDFSGKFPPILPGQIFHCRHTVQFIATKNGR
jgi:hypothetical protein